MSRLFSTRGHSGWRLKAIIFALATSGVFATFTAPPDSGLAAALSHATSEPFYWPAERLQTENKQTKQLRHDASDVNVRMMAAETLARYRNDPAFNYDRTPPTATSFWQRLHHWFMSIVYRILTSESMRPIWRLLPYVLVGAATLLVISRLLRTRMHRMFFPSGTKKSESHEMERDIEAIDFQALIAEAVTQRHYRRAIRMLYLKTLKQLSQTGYISWKPEKTNYDYVTELHGSNLRQPFAKLTYIFENIWYGEFPVDDRLFGQVQQQFTEFGRQIAMGDR